MAPFYTIVIGGNHEDLVFLGSMYKLILLINHCRPDGGLLAHNIYYIGRSGFVNFKGKIIGGISGTYSKYKFASLPSNCDHYYRNSDFNKIQQNLKDVDIFISHDWPQNIAHYGKLDDLLKVKSFLRREIFSGEFGSPPLFRLLHEMKPKYWFSAHMHIFYEAYYGPTRFIALNKKTFHEGWSYSIYL